MNDDIAPFIKNYPYKAVNMEIEKNILQDFNNQVIHTSPEYQTNPNVNNLQIVSSLLCVPLSVCFSFSNMA